jgi:excisionase family DNA binding protein
MTDPPPIVQDGATVTITGAALLAAVYRCVLDGIARRRRDGYPTHALQQLARALRRAHDEVTSYQRHEVSHAGETSACCDGQEPRDWCTTGEAALLLGLSRRQAQRLAAETGLDGVRVGRTWMLRLAPVLTLADERKARNDQPPNGIPG